MFSLILVVGQLALAGDLMSAHALTGPYKRQTCKAVVAQVVGKYVQQKVEVLSYENTTPGSYDQEFVAVVRLNGKLRTLELTGQFDCDSLRVQSIR